ncbi:dephospho-CoA kinase [Desulfomicrobium escambiense]|uniref:dephospho-CoA kinase n=1 Tax=Desulfomicrobium escambiense TaxID=29503 RepID=UPI000404E074|nr:dephospho-CoA kinase [Desulfomicrobium escambiense]
MQEFVEKAHAADGGQRLDAFWQGVLDEDGVTRSRVQTWIRDGRARIDGKVCTKPAAKVLPGQVLSLLPEFPDSDIVPVDGPLNVLYADEHLAVVDKEAGLTVHPAPSVSGTTLVHRAAARFPSLLALGGQRPGVVHRLDKDTSGLMVLALSEPARLALSEGFASRDVSKEYLALVAGVPPASGAVTLPLDRHPTIKTRMAVAERGGRAAESRYRLVWTAPDRTASLVRVRILTGRTHQIRVHMTALGHPLLGDAVYADRKTAARAPRQMLHAWRLRFRHPTGGEELSFSAAPPADFLHVLRELSRERVCIGLTGAVGGGKSTVRAAVEEAGVPVFCADRVVAGSYARGGEGCAILEHHFGQRFTAADGGVDKDHLRKAMQDPSLRREVERLVHPLVRHALADFRARHAEDVTLAEIPLLCEAGLAGETNLVAAVFCPDGVRHERLRGRGWSDERIAEIDSWQWPQARKVRAAHLVIDNSGSLDELRTRARSMLTVVRDMLRARSQRDMEKLRDLFEHPDTFDETD